MEGDTKESGERLQKVLQISRRYSGTLLYEQKKKEKTVELFGNATHEFVCNNLIVFFSETVQKQCYTVNNAATDSYSQFTILVSGELKRLIQKSRSSKQNKKN